MRNSQCKRKGTPTRGGRAREARLAYISDYIFEFRSVFFQKTLNN